MYGIFRKLLLLLFFFFLSCVKMYWEFFLLFWFLWSLYTREWKIGLLMVCRWSNWSCLKVGSHCGLFQGYTHGYDFHSCLFSIWWNTPFIYCLLKYCKKKRCCLKFRSGSVKVLQEKTGSMWYLMLLWETALQEHLQSRWTRIDKTDTGIE